MKFSSDVLIFALALMINYCLLGQENKIIEIREAGGSKKIRKFTQELIFFLKTQKKEFYCFMKGL